MASNLLSTPKQSSSDTNDGSTAKNGGGSSAGATGSTEKRYESRRVKIKTVPFELDDTPTVKRKSAAASSTPNNNKELLYERNDFLAVRNDQDGYFLCRAQQNVYSTTTTFTIQWLEEEPVGSHTYVVGFIDQMNIKCVLVEVKPQRIEKNKYVLPLAQISLAEEALADVLGGAVTKSSPSKGRPQKKAKGVDDDDVADSDEKEDDIDEPQKKKPKVSKKMSTSADNGKAAAEKESFSSPEDVYDFPGTPKKMKSSKKQDKETSTPKKTPGSSKAADKKANSVKKDNGEGKKNAGGEENKKKVKEVVAKPVKISKGTLVPHPSVKVWEKDPMLETIETVPFVSTTAHSKLLFRAIQLDDNVMLRNLIDDRRQVAKVDIPHSVAWFVDPLQLALRRENAAAIRLLSTELFTLATAGKKKLERAAATSCILSKQDTGSYNSRSLGGVPYVRKVAVSRGSREGNNAFTKDCHHSTYNLDSHHHVTYAMTVGVSKKTLDNFVIAASSDPVSGNDVQSFIYEDIHVAIANGHRKLAGAILEDLAKTGATQFNALHRQVLLFDNEDLPAGIRAASVSKKPWNNKRITPLHCAAINPNPKYLSKLLTILPEHNIADYCQRRPIHFAVACEGTGPLELLLNRGIDQDDPDGSGMSPLMIACATGRACNVDLLLTRAKKSAPAAHDMTPSAKTKVAGRKKVVDGEEEDEADTVIINRYGVGGINRAIAKPMNKLYSYCPIHLAAHYGHEEVLRVLLSYEPDVDRELSASKNKMTALIIAASMGHLSILRLLIQHGAKAGKSDKLKRTALAHAAMNGHAHVISFLLNQGVNPNEPDSSGNTPLHYAVGYGWYFCTRILLDARANPNVPNDWKTTPLAVAFMKGHMGLADLLLEQPSVDINFRLDSGMTLVSVACSSLLTDDIVEQLEYLVVKKKADCTIVDKDEANPLHHLARNSIDETQSGRRRYGLSESEKAKKIAEVTEKCMKMAEILISHGCDPSAKDTHGLTPVMYAVQSGNFSLVQYLIGRGSIVSDTRDADNRNVLHYLSEQCMVHALTSVLNQIQKSVTTDQAEMLVEMCKQIDVHGFTPLMVACCKYHEWDGKFEAGTYEDQPEEDSDLDEDDTDGDDDEDDGDGEEPDAAAEADDSLEKKDINDSSELHMDIPDGDHGAGGDTDVEDEDSTAKQGTVLTKEDPQSPEKSNKKITVQQGWMAGRKYIAALVELCPDSVTIPLQKKQFKKCDPVPSKVEDQYYKKEVAGFSAVHFLVEVPDEPELEGSKSGDPDEYLESCAGLKVLLCVMKTRKEAANMFDLSGRTPLMMAINNCNVNSAKKLIEFGVDVNIKSLNKEQDGYGTPIILAADTRQHLLIPLLLKYGAGVSDIDCRNSNTPLLAVLAKPASGWLSKAVDALLQAKASVTACDKDVKTPLHILVEHARDSLEAVAVATMLVKAGASVNATEKHGRTPLHLCVNSNKGGADSSTVLEQFLLDNGADPFAQDIRRRMPIHYVFVKIKNYTLSSAFDPIELCSTLTSSTDRAKGMVNHEDEFGLTALHVAARRGAGVCCIHLIQKGASVNGRDYEGNTPLALAVANGHESCTILLLQKNADIGVNIVIVPPKIFKADDSKAEDDSEEEESVNLFGVTKRNKKNKRSLLQTSPGSSKGHDTCDEEDDEKKKKKKPAWMWKPLRAVEKPVETQTYSLFQGVVARDWQGITFLMVDMLDSFKLTLTSVIHAAVVTNKYHLALSLLRKVKNQRDLMIRMENGQTLAHVLARSSESDCDTGELITSVAQMLKDKQVDFAAEDDLGCTPLHYACLQGNKPLVVFILKGCGQSNLEVKDRQGRTPLAALFWKLNKNGDLVVAIAEALHKQKASLDVLCSYPNQQIYQYGHRQKIEDEDYTRPSTSLPSISPLMLAIYQHNFALTQALIALGADVNFSDADGRSPLMLAVSENNVHIVRLLLDHKYTIDETAEEDEDAEKTSGEPLTLKQGRLKKQPSRKLFGLGLKSQSLKRQKSGSSSATQSSSADPTSSIINGLNMKYKTHPKTSCVNVRAVDNNGRTVLHYLVRSFPNGSYDNYRMLQQLVAVGTPLEQADKDGQTVLDFALAHGLPRLSTAIQYLMNKNRKQYSRPNTAGILAQDGINWNGTPVPDFKTDAATYLAVFEEEWAREEGKSELEYKTEPDENLSLAATGTVLVDADLDLPYDVLLFKIDVAAGAWGMYNFYKMQLIHQKGKDLYILFTRWGRIGDKGQFQQTPFSQLEDAVKEFRKIFRSKTSNDWLHSKSFEHKVGKYRLVPLEERQYGKRLNDVNLNLTSTLPSKLHPYVQDLIQELTDVTALSKTMEHIGVDQNITPLGRIKKESLVKAKKILLELEKHVEAVEKIKNTMPIVDADAYRKELEKIAHLTNEYYHLVPHSGFEYERIPILDKPTLLKKEWHNVETLLDLEMAMKVMVGAQYRIKEMNPMDYVYRSMRCVIQLMDENETVAQYILRYVSATFKGKVEAIYHVSREGEDKRLENCTLGNHRLLFHGSSSSNLISILSRGLLITPPDAPAAGYNFGKGIYTADRFSKSHNYCYNYSQMSNTKFMLVCEVALGKVNEVNAPNTDLKVSTDFDSVRAVGTNRPDPQFDVTLPTGAVIPLGASKTYTTPPGFYSRRYLADNEYIVYREEQVCLRYIVQFVD